MWSRRRVVLALIVAGVVVHSVALLAARFRTGQVDGYASRSLDSREYYAIARNVVKHGTFSQSTGPPFKPDTWRTPGYSLVLAVLMAVFGDSPATLVIAQQALSILNMLLVFWITATWVREQRAALVAALFLIEPYHVFYSLWLLSTTLFTTVLLAAWYLWTRASGGRDRSRMWFALLGAVAGMLVLIAPVAVAVPVALAAGAAISEILRGKKAGRRVPTTLKPALLAVGLFAAGCAPVVGSWMARNLVVAGRFALSHQSGIVLAYFKATEVELCRQGRGADRYVETSLDPAAAGRPHTVWDQIDARLQGELSHLPQDQRQALRWPNLAQGNRTEVDSFVISRALSAIGWSYLGQSPLDTAFCCLARCASLLTFPINLGLRPPTGIETSRLASFIKGFFYAGLLVGVLARLARGRLQFSAAYFPLACTIALLITTTPQLDPRFRVPMIPLLLFIALLPKS